MSSEKGVATGRHLRLADSDDSDDEKATILTAARAAELCPKHYRLIAQNIALRGLEDLSTLSSLDYVDLRDNHISSLQGLSRLSRLKTLNVRNNQLSDLTPVLNIEALRILNISDNSFLSTEWLSRASFAPQLQALVAKGNQLTNLESVLCLTSIRTLIVSDNQIEDITPLTRLSSLTKLSLSNNEIRRIPDEIGNLSVLSELRLAHNKLSSLPSPQALAKLSALKILDIGHNRITSLDNLSACSRVLTSINVKNNPCSQREDIDEYLRALCANLQIIDGTRVAGGRRKLRVNRLRTAAGLPIEKERKYARAPSAYYMKKAGLSPEHDTTAKRQRLDQSKSSNPSYAEPGIATVETGGPNPSKSQSDMHRKKLSTVEEDDREDEHNVICADEFVRMAQSRKSKKQKVPADGVALRAASKNRGVKRKVERGDVNSHINQEFGTGGTSRWE